MRGLGLEICHKSQNVYVIGLEVKEFYNTLVNLEDGISTIIRYKKNVSALFNSANIGNGEVLIQKDNNTSEWIMKPPIYLITI